MDRGEHLIHSPENPSHMPKLDSNLKLILHKKCNAFYTTFVCRTKLLTLYGNAHFRSTCKLPEFISLHASFRKGINILHQWRTGEGDVKFSLSTTNISCVLETIFSTSDSENIREANLWSIKMLFLSFLSITKRKAINKNQK